MYCMCKLAATLTMITYINFVFCLILFVNTAICHSWLGALFYFIICTSFVDLVLFVLLTWLLLVFFLLYFFTLQRRNICLKSLYCTGWVACTKGADLKRITKRMKHKTIIQQVINKSIAQLTRQHITAGRIYEILLTGLCNSSLNLFCHSILQGGI